VLGDLDARRECAGKARQDQDASGRSVSRQARELIQVREPQNVDRRNVDGKPDEARPFRI
jgi:hypothetical protein